MNDKRIVLDIAAKVVWLEPPKDDTERIMREQADAIVNKAAHDLNHVFTLILAEFVAKAK